LLGVVVVVAVLPLGVVAYDPLPIVQRLALSILHRLAILRNYHLIVSILLMMPLVIVCLSHLLLL
jgi:hypothetical protein